MSLLPFFEWMEAQAISRTIQSGAWYSPIIQVTHLVAIAVFVGALLIVDLRLLGRGLTSKPTSRVARDAQPWLVGGLIVLLITGIPQVMSLAMKQYYSPHFWWKMEIMAVAAIFTFTVRSWVAFGDETRMNPMVPKLIGLVSIGMWTTVTVMARLIGLLS
jgi:hypothetical protein